MRLHWLIDGAVRLLKIFHHKPIDLMDFGFAMPAEDRGMDVDKLLENKWMR